MLTVRLTGYGGFTISISPFFSPSILTFLRAYGAILAVPNIRGGGEFGEEWHLGGARERKVRCFALTVKFFRCDRSAGQLLRRLHFCYVSVPHGCSLFVTGSELPQYF